MAVDTVAKRMAVGGVPFSPLGVSVYPGTTSTVAGRAAIAWNYALIDPTPPVGDGSGDDGIVCGTLPLGGHGASHARCVGTGSWFT